MPTARSIDLVELPVASAEAVRASSAFFATVFGWSFATYGDEYADTADSRVTFGLNGSNPEAKSSAPLAVLYVDDLEAARDAVIASGGAVTRPIFAFPGGRRFHFVEPSGNELAAWSDRETTTGQGEKTVSAEYAGSDQFRGARIHLCDLAGLEIRDCDVTRLKIVDSYGSDVYLGGDFTRLVVNDVDVTAYVEAELDQRHPARVLARDANTPDDYRAAWDAIEIHWAATLDRARLLPEATLHERVNGEWSFVETQRHLLMASDAWLGNAVLEEEAPYDPLGLPHGGMPRDAAAQMGLSLEATPTLDEVLAPRRARMATMRRVVDGLTDAELDRMCGRKPADPYPDQDYVVRRCLKVVLKEEAEHHRYAVRDLAVLEARAPSEKPEL